MSHAENITPGALVATARVHSGGIFKDVVESVCCRDGAKWAVGSGWAYPVSDLIFLRSPREAGRRSENSGR